MGVASIDTYLHWLVHRVDLSVLPQELAKLQVSFSDLVDMGKKSVENRNAGIVDRPMVRARNVLHKRIMRDSYQSARNVELALQMAGIKAIWSGLAKEMGEPASDIKTHLNHVSSRRNAVVHEGDIERLSRPQAIRRQDLSAADVRAELDWVRRFVTALAVVAP